MEIVFKRGNVDIEKARRALINCTAEYQDFDSRKVGAETIANYVLPRESNGFEGYSRYPIPQKSEEDRDTNELHLYFSPRAFQPYRITFIHLVSDGSLGFDVYSEVWARKIAAQLMSTGVVKREV